MNFDEAYDQYRSCRLCPRSCGVDRTAGQKGACNESAQLRIATVEAHMGEEPPISGLNGSCTVFLSGCSLRCIYCQNHQISHHGIGREYTVEEVVERTISLRIHHGIHNVNFVTPDHFIPHCAAVVQLLRKRNFPLPVVYNLSGYQSLESLDMIEPFADIYLPDFKYSDQTLAKRLSRCPDYPSIALNALVLMIRQKGFLSESTLRLATKGVLVRHLILPGQVKNSVDALTTLYVEFGRDLPISLMAQYTPVRSFPDDPILSSRVTREEFDEILEHALSLGFNNLFAQYPEKASAARPFLPDFTRDRPFGGNRRV